MYECEEAREFVVNCVRNMDRSKSVDVAKVFLKFIER